MTTTTAAKIPAGPTTWSSDVKPVAWLATGTWTATNSSFAAQTTTWIDKVEVFLVGQPDAAKEPAKTMNTWATTHAAAITAAGLTDVLKVSSWAILVDVTTKAGANVGVLAKDLYNQAIAKNGATCLDTPTVSANAPDANAPAVGTAGDTWAIQISTGSTYVPAAIRSGYYVSTKAAANVAQASTLDEKSWTVTASPVIAKWDTYVATTFTFGAEAKCDETKWASATACRGFGGVWGINANTWAVGTTKGMHRYFHWLADSVTDKTKNLAVEDKDVVNVVVIESRALIFSTAVGQNTNSCKDGSGLTTFGLATKAYAKGSGATSTILGASALIAGVLASLF